MKKFAGIDIGSTSIKIAITDEEGTLVAHRITPTGSLFHKNTVAAFESLLHEAGIGREEIGAIVSTGYGRKLFKEADLSVSEITANGVGAANLGHSAVRTIINIGGQDLKVIRLDNDGHVSDFAMNDKCAAGTGRFLEMTARNLEIEVDELGSYHENSRGVPVVINSTCTVFAESEIISLLAAGHAKEDLVAGIHYAIARRVARLARRLGVEDTVLFDGGPAVNRGLVIALEDELMREVVVPELPQLTTAYGAALLAGEYVDTEVERCCA
ncbi:MAG: CoA activase [Proteobacteria bacterium]|nr:CoA activase [Desulfobulbaceae bacterium]MBU4152688.1 CoA activase [Pseudomonadota bacterium]